jgi:alpha-ribazole phosphatase
MNEILFIRHAETAMAGTFCGHSDPPLNARGSEQISQLLSRLSAESIEAVYTSDLLRARETGQAIAASREIGCYLRPALREIYFGQWEGLTWNEIERADATYAQRWLAEYPNLPSPNGENLRDFEDRVLSEVESLMIRAQGKHIAVVTHAGVLRTLLCKLCGCTEDDAREQTRSYCSIVRYKVSTLHIARVSEVLA